MWQFKDQPINDGAARTLCIAQDEVALSWRQVVELWRSDPLFCDAFSEYIAEAPFEAVFWECAPISLNSLDSAFECVLLEAPELHGLAADPLPFARHFRPTEHVARFPGLRSDAFLIAPTPRASHDVYPHLTTFVRGATRTQKRAFWCALGEAVAERLTPAPLWISTSGLGVTWLHARLDTRPKYYRHAPYREIPKPERD